MSSSRGSARALVIGRSPEVNRSVVEPLLDAGIDAQGSTQPEEASRRFDAGQFDLIAFGRGVPGPLRDRLKGQFAAQNPGIRFVDVIAPVAVKQILAALAHDPLSPRFIRDITTVQSEAADRVSATILIRCHLTLTIYRVIDAKLVSEILAEEDVTPGHYEWTGASGTLDDANSLVVIADEDEYHLHAFWARHQRLTRPDFLIADGKGAQAAGTGDPGGMPSPGTAGTDVRNPAQSTPARKETGQ